MSMAESTGSAFDALGLMQTLRKKGVRSHWWI